MPSRRTFKERILRDAREQTNLNGIDLDASFTALTAHTPLIATDSVTVLTTAGYAKRTLASVLRTFVLGITAGVVTIPEPVSLGSSLQVATTVSVGRGTPTVNLDALDTFGVAPSGVGYPQVLGLGLPARFYAIDNNVGTARWGFIAGRVGDHRFGGDFGFYKTRAANGTDRSPVADADTIGEITWQGVTATGGTVRVGAAIVGLVAGAVSSGVLPIDLLFGTNPSADVINEQNARWRLKSTGHWVPEANNAYTVGTAALRPSALYGVLGDFSSNVVVGGTLSVTGATTLTGSLTANGAVTLSPANATVTISPTGTGTVTVNPATAGTLNNVVIGGVTPLAGTFTTVNATTGTFTNVAGTLTTVAQPNVTSVGTLTSLGVGAVTATGLLQTTLTTEQLRLRYDALNYMSVTVGSSGGVTFDAVGAGAAFTFSDAVSAPSFSGSFTGNASTATTLQTARLLWGQSFDGSADVSGAMSGITTLAASGAVTIGGTLGVTGAVTGGTYNGQTISSAASLTGTLAVAGQSVFSGNVGIGVTPDAGAKLHLLDAAGAVIRLVRTTNRFDIGADTDFLSINARDASTYLQFKTADIERARITSGGHFKASNDGTYYAVTGTYHELRSTTNNSVLAILQHAGSTATQQYGPRIDLTGDPNNTTNFFAEFRGGVTLRAILYSNGDWHTARGLYGRLDDTDSYFQLGGADTASIFTGNVARATFDNTGVNIPTLTVINFTTTGNIFAPAGSAPGPAYSTTGDTNTGLYFSAPDTINAAINGGEALRINALTVVGETSLWVLGDVGMRRVVAGAADSGGAGFRELRIAN